MTMWEKVQETVDFLKPFIKETPETGIILGSGLGNLVQDMTIAHRIKYKDIPHFPVSTVEGHKGNLITGTLGNKAVIAMQGRFHYYEGYSMKEVTYPVRVLRGLGVRNLIVSNASGGVNPSYETGDVVVITDHINHFPEHPLRGENDERFGPRFVNMAEPYKKSWISGLEQLAHQLDIRVKRGVYFGLSGPTFETLSEYNMVRTLGADCVGMSTVPEVIVARHMGMNCLGISIISDMGTHEQIHKVSHEEVLKAITSAEPKARLLIKEFINHI